MKYQLAIAVLLACIAVPAFAHITANPDHATAGGYFQTSFRVSHGCDGSATTALHVRILEGVLSVHAQAKPGWTIEVKKHKLDQPVMAGHGKTIDEVVDEVTWTGAILPDDQYDDFGLIMFLPNGAGQVLWFPTVQECDDKAVHWTDIPATIEGWHELEHPAPYVTLTASASNVDMHHHH